MLELVLLLKKHFMGKKKCVKSSAKKISIIKGDITFRNTKEIVIKMTIKKDV